MRFITLSGIPAMTMALSVRKIILLEVLLVICFMSHLSLECPRRRCTRRNCILGEWADWKCSHPCGGGVMTRRKVIIQFASCGGAPCKSVVEETTQACNQFCHGGADYVDNKCQCQPGNDHRCCSRPNDYGQ